MPLSEEAPGSVRKPTCLFQLTFAPAFLQESSKESLTLSKLVLRKKTEFQLKYLIT